LTDTIPVKIMVLLNSVDYETQKQNYETL